ncbi:ataxin-7-like protein 3 isoform X2 [Lineus longissimus]|uniref:ataxin-7-like protein 3 isoform X2 n=1 Tax=Lineus longissimus TaxID=88925 RepID=UPI002B4CFCF4
MASESRRAQELYSEVMYDLIDEMTLGVCFETHRSAKIGTLFLADLDPESNIAFKTVDEKGLDVFGQVPMKKQLECVCPSCSRNLAASRFAPHLEKCMGMGRNSSRIASRRIARAGVKKENHSDNELQNSDDEQDFEWNDRKARRRRDRAYANSPRLKTKSSRPKNGKTKLNGGGTGGDVHSQPLVIEPPMYESMTLDERKSLLLMTCGVISEHTKKMCTRSMKCPQHSDDQRKAVRGYLLGQSSCLDPVDEIHVDIDTYDDGDSQAMRDTLQWEAASAPSPADSTSTTTSNSSKKRKKCKSNLSSKKKKKTLTRPGSRDNSAVTTDAGNLYEFV